MSEVKKQALKQIRLYCVNHCMNNQTDEVLHCPSTNCLFYNMRFGKNKTDPHKTASAQIRAYCADCSDGNKKIHTCNFTDCELYTFRVKSRTQHACKIDSKDGKCTNRSDTEV